LLFALPTEAHLSKVYDTIAEWNSLIQKRRLNKGKLIWRPFNGSMLQKHRPGGAVPPAATTRGAGPSKAGACQPAAGLGADLAFLALAFSRSSQGNYSTQDKKSPFMIMSITARTSLVSHVAAPHPLCIAHYTRLIRPTTYVARIASKIHFFAYVATFDRTTLESRSITPFASQK
jgi:hypothetical protein